MFKSLYFLVFCSLDILLYLRLGKKDKKVTKWLFIAIAVWAVFFAMHLPVFDIPGLISLRNVTIFSVMIIQLLLVHYFGTRSLRRFEKVPMFDDVKSVFLTWWGFMINTFIFFLFLLIHIVFILGIPY